MQTKQTGHFNKPHYIHDLYLDSTNFYSMTSRDCNRVADQIELRIRLGSLEREMAKKTEALAEINMV